MDQPPEWSVPLRDVVKAGQNVRLGDEVDVQTVKQVPDLPGGVDPGVWDEVIANTGRQPVHERQAPEIVPPEQVEAVRFVRVEPIRCVDQNVTAASQAPVRLADRQAVVVDVLDDLVEEDDVELSIGVGEMLARRNLDVREPLAGLGHLVWIDIDTVHLIAEATELVDVHAEAAADVEDLATFEGDVLADLIEPPVLAA